MRRFFIIFSVFFVAVLIYEISPPAVTISGDVFYVPSGAGVGEVARALHNKGYIRSQFLFKAFVIASGNSRSIQSGGYRISPAFSPVIARQLVMGPEKVRITIPEGYASYDIDALLGVRGITRPGEFALYVEAHSLEGMLFPDTYDFYIGAGAAVVAQKMKQNFDDKIKSIIKGDAAYPSEGIILASILEKEVLANDMKVVAGILLKRLQKKMPLQVDASVCYTKKRADFERKKGVPGTLPCYPLTPLDFILDSPYNTYLYTGFPPGPIASPGVEALLAAVNPVESPYWYYLNDPKTGHTVYAKTYDEHLVNRRMYLNTR